MSRKIGVVTGSRADYGLLQPLLRAIAAHEELALRLYVTGSHLSRRLHSVDEIRADGMPVAAEVYIGEEFDGAAAVAAATGEAVKGFGAVFEKERPELLFLLGDRSEIFAAGAAAALCRVPIAHLHGGECSEGAVDEVFRHALTKMSYLHFASHEVARRRIIRMGEAPERVFRVGAVGLENLHELDFPTRAELEAELSFSFGPRSVVVTFHPETLAEPAAAERQVAALLAALDDVGAQALITGTNADCGGERVAALLAAYRERNPERCRLVPSLGTRRYLAAIRYAAGVVGNSSSGLLEAPALHQGTVDIGDRQRGRLAAASVIHCGHSREEIAAALEKLFSPEFRRTLPEVRSPYGDGRGVAATILDHCRPFLERGIDLRKTFYAPELEVAP